MPVPEGSREIDILGCSAGSYTGLVAVPEVLNEFVCFPSYQLLQGTAHRCLFEHDFGKKGRSHGPN